MIKHQHIISRAAIKAIAVGGFTLPGWVTDKHGTVQLPVIRLNAGVHIHRESTVLSDAGITA